MKAVVAAFNQEKALVGAFSVITNLRMELFGALIATDAGPGHDLQPRGWGGYFMLPTGSQDNIWTCNVCLQIVQTSVIKQT